MFKSLIKEQTLNKLKEKTKYFSKNYLKFCNCEQKFVINNKNNCFCDMNANTINETILKKIIFCDMLEKNIKKNTYCLCDSKCSGSQSELHLYKI